MKESIFIPIITKCTNTNVKYMMIVNIQDIKHRSNPIHGMVQSKQEPVYMDVALLPVSNLGISIFIQLLLVNDNNMQSFNE